MCFIYNLFIIFTVSIVAQILISEKTSIMKNYFFLFSSLLLSLSMIAQTGPGGVGNSVNNVVWLDGNEFTFGSYPLISAWTDQSGNGNDFIQASSNRQPQITNYYGFSALKFDGTDFFRTGGIPALDANNHTQYVVYNGSRPNHVGVLFLSEYASSKNFGTTRYNSGIRSSMRVDALTLLQNNTSNTSNFQIITGLWDGGLQTFDSYKNGTNFGQNIGATGSPVGNHTNTVGINPNNNFGFDGDIGEIIIYNTALNSAQRNIVDNYLSSKFNIAVSNDMYAFDAGLTHRFDVIGVGQEADGNNLVAQGKSIVQITAAGLSNGDYVFAGHNNVGLTQVTNDVPAVISGGSRTTRTWRSDITGTPGNVDLVFDVSSLPLLPGSYYLLVESNNGVFNDGGVVTYGPFVGVGGLVTFSGVTLADGDYFTIGTDNGSVITSIKTGFWDVASTWNCNCVPGAADDATITNGHTVSARTTTNINNLTVNGNLNTQSTGAFNIKGDYTVSATGTATHKSVTFNGSSQQDVANNSATTVNFFTLTINNANNVTLQNGSFSVSNSLRTLSGQLQNVGAEFTFLSTASSTAVIINGSGGFSGDFIVQRHVSTRNANWGDLSSPVSNATLGGWDSDPSNTVTELYMSGVNGIDGNAGSFESVHRFNPLSQSFAAVTDTNFALAPGIGLEMWLGDDFTTWNAKTFDTRGTPNFGDIPIPVQNDFNLVGNPYQAWISWGSLTKPTLQSTYYIYNTNAGTYDARTVGNIPPHQGFWVESVGSGTLTFTESSKTGSGSSQFFKGDIESFTFPNIDDEEFMNQGEEPFVFEEVKLKVSSDINSYSHELKLRLNNLATKDYDNFDASFLKSRTIGAPSITSFANNSNKELAINSFTYDDEVIVSVKVNVDVTGSYFIEPINFSKLASDYKYMELTDKQTGKVYDLHGYYREGIKVEIDENDDSERFSLRLSNESASNFVDDNAPINIYKSFENTLLEFANTNIKYDITVYNAIGQIIIETSVSGESELQISNDKMSSGINIITVKSIEGVVTKKINY